MNQQCKVCGEPAAGFHFGAFTCEGCKSFFGRSYNNLSSITECKSGGMCVINKKNRTACKACRLRKCLMVGMSKSGSRYGRRSNWFKIHCLLQEQHQQQQHQQQQQNQQLQQLEQEQQQQQQQQQQQIIMQQQQQEQQQRQQEQLQRQQEQQIRHAHFLAASPQFMQQRKLMTPPLVLNPAHRSREDMLAMGLEEYKASSTSSISSSPPSNNSDNSASDSSVEVPERRPVFPSPSPAYRSVPPHLQLPNLPVGIQMASFSLLTPPAFMTAPGYNVMSPYHLYAASQTLPQLLAAYHPLNIGPTRSRDIPATVTSANASERTRPYPEPDNRYLRPSNSRASPYEEPNAPAEPPVQQPNFDLTSQRYPSFSVRDLRITHTPNPSPEGVEERPEERPALPEEAEAREVEEEEEEGPIDLSMKPPPAEDPE